MAIKLPDPGNGIPEQKTGNDEWTNMKIVRENFADQSNAASRLVGVSAVNIPSGADLSASYSANWLPKTYDGGDVDAAKLPLGVTYIYTPQMPILASSLPIGRPALATYRMTGDTLLQLCYPSAFSGTTDYHYRVLKDSDTPSEWVKVYTTNNTTKDSNGFLKGKSPVTRLFSDRLEHQGEDKELQGIEFKRLGVGDYLLKNTTGLSNDGWYIELPQDANKNPLFAIIYNDDGKGNLSIKTYKRKFDFETVSIVADTDNPVDIPETRWVDLRFNELPQEQLDEPAI